MECLLCTSIIHPQLIGHFLWDLIVACLQVLESWLYMEKIFDEKGKVVLMVSYSGLLPSQLHLQSLCHQWLEYGHRPRGWSQLWIHPCTRYPSFCWMLFQLRRPTKISTKQRGREQSGIVFYSHFSKAFLNLFQDSISAIKVFHLQHMQHFKCLKFHYELICKLLIFS